MVLNHILLALYFHLFCHQDFLEENQSLELFKNSNKIKILALSSNKIKSDIFDDKIYLPTSVKDINFIINFITDVRSIRAKLNISPANLVDLNIEELSQKSQEIIYNNELIINKLGRINNFNLKGVNSKIAKVIFTCFVYFISGID